jgi:hypothetical protein
VKIKKIFVVIAGQVGRGQGMDGSPWSGSRSLPYVSVNNVTTYRQQCPVSIFIVNISFIIFYNLLRLNLNCVLE